MITDDAILLSKVKRLLEVLRASAPSSADGLKEGPIAASTVFGAAALGSEEPDNSGQLLKEPEPVPVLRAEVKRMVDEQRDMHVLSSVLAFLRGSQDELVGRSVLSARAAHAEADLAAGRIYTQAQVEAHFKARRAQ